MKAQTEIQAMDCSENAEAKDSNETFVSGYRMGYASARSLASVIAAKHDLTAGLMAEALEEVDLDDPAIVEVIGWHAVFLISSALQAYREQAEHQNTEGVE